MKSAGSNLAIALAMLSVTSGGHAQNAKPLGTVATADANVTSSSAEVVSASGSRAEIGSGATVTAKASHNADVTLARGGSVLVCQTTAVHMTATNDSLLLALDRGAMEIRMKAATSDVVMTPDLRFTLAEAGPLDLRMRVTFNGDTCVENRGHKAPQLNVSDAFGETSYLLKPGQHVMFEHGNLKAVMDRETTPCGCPPEEKRPAGMSLADAALRGGQSAPVTPAQAAAAHPFPAAVSDGLAQPDPGQPETPGVRHVQVSSTLRYDPGATGDAKEPVAAPAPVAAVQSPPAQPAQKHGPFAAIGRFFKRIFVR
jgi:hypothetical protein